jgi:transcriptional regulator with XRE-family HTH domain
MAIQFRSTTKRTPRDHSIDAILSKEDFEDAVAAVNMTLADIAKQTGINRQYLSEFKCGDRNLRAEMREKLREFFESKGVEFVGADSNLDEDDDTPSSTRPTRIAAALAAVFPSPTFALSVAADLPEGDRAAALAEVDAIVRENDRKLAMPVGYTSPLIFDPELSDDAKAVNEELSQGLAYESVLRRVLAGSFKARYAEGNAPTHADLIAQQLLGHLPNTDPEPLADSSDEDSVADAASAGAARGKGPAPKDSKATLFG